MTIKIFVIKMKSKLLIKNMVCDRCVMTVKDILHKQNIPFENVTLGEVELTKKLSAE
jgi:copper chaperone CopZ